MKKFNIILFTSLILIVLIALVIFIIQFANSKGNTVLPMSYTSSPLSNDQVNTSLQDLSFKVQQSTIDPRKPYSDTFITFLTKTASGSTYTSKFLYPSTLLVSFPKFQLVLSSGGEGNPLFEDPSEFNQKIETNDTNDIYRIDLTKDQDAHGFLKYMNLDDSKYIFTYTDAYQNDCGVTGAGFCSTTYVDSKNISSIKCYINNIDDLHFCDEIIQNLKIENK